MLSRIYALKFKGGRLLGSVSRKLDMKMQRPESYCPKEDKNKECESDKDQQVQFRPTEKRGGGQCAREGM